MPFLIQPRRHRNPVMEALDALEGRKPVPRARKEAKEPAPRSPAAAKKTRKGQKP